MVALQRRVNVQRAQPIAGEGELDPASLLILKALSGDGGKVEIGGRRYTFSCIPTFRLRDEQSGRIHDCRDSASLLERVLRLLKEPDAPRGIVRESS